jgi:hypothetical protein
MRASCIALLVWMILGASALGTPEAVLGSDFADAYAAFAPLEALYRSFGDHLFSGSSIVVPSGLSAACEAYVARLDVLHEDLVLQTAAADAEALGDLVRLRVNAEEFCSAFTADLIALNAAGDVPSAVEDRLVADRFFAQIHVLDLGFERTLDAALAAAPTEEAHWVMAVTFAVRTLAVSAGGIRVAPDSAALFYGQEEGTAPPFAVPEAVAAAMADIVGLAGAELTEDGAAAVRVSATLIYEHFIRQSP